MPADDTKIAAALRLEVDKGDRDAMRALADMQVHGRGFSARCLALLRCATAAGSAAAAEHLSNLSLHDAPGIPHNPAESHRWLMRAALVDSPAAQEMLSEVLA